MKAEFDLVKQKHRSTQNILERERDKAVDQHEKVLGELGQAQARALAVKAEFDLVKQKYRSTQNILERERAKLQRLRDGIELVNVSLARLKSGWGYRLEARIRTIATSSSKIFRVGGGRRANRNDQLRTIRESGLFDESNYLEMNRDVAAANIDPAKHFLDIGWREGRSPSAAFSTTRYLKRHADVAALAINPLLHYLEHGRFEGREYFGTGLAKVERAKSGLLGPPKPPAAPVFEGVWERSKNVAWQRACHLFTNEHAIAVDDLGLGTASATVSRVTVEAALADLAILSGESGEVAVEAIAAGKVPELIDGYFTTTRRLVMRWAVTEGTVVRAVQIQPASGQLTIVGEGIASSPLDVVEFDLLAPMLPLMLVATSPDGEIEGLACLAFPSLLRGGPHYVETVSDDADKRVSPMDFSVALERSLRGLRSGKSKPLVKKIKVDLGGADASTPLFQRDLRDMLSRVIGIALLPECQKQPIRV